MIHVTITASELADAGACSEGGDLQHNGMALFRAIGKLQWGLADPPCIVVPRWTVLHTLWFATAYPSHYGWLRDKSLIPCVSLRGANLGGAYLRGANLGGANLRDANLVGANLVGANLRGANLGGAYLGGANLVGANLVGANLRGANLVGANLRGANLGGANRYRSDPVIVGWTLVDGSLSRT